MKKRIGAIFFWGAIWGITEATIGYLLHLLPINFGWAVWFPMAFFFMNGVRRGTGSNGAVIASAFIAAAVKFINIMIPGSVDRVVNPAASILFESLGVFIVYKTLVRDKSPSPAGYAGVFIASFLWRALYAGYILLLPDWMARISPVANPASALDFLLVQSFVNAVSIIAVLGLYRALRSKLSFIVQTRHIGEENRIFGNKTARILRDMIPYSLLLVSLAVTRIL